MKALPVLFKTQLKRTLILPWRGLRSSKKSSCKKLITTWCDGPCWWSQHDGLWVIMAGEGTALLPWECGAHYHTARKPSPEFTVQLGIKRWLGVSQTSIAKAQRYIRDGCFVGVLQVFSQCWSKRELMFTWHDRLCSKSFTGNFLFCACKGTVLFMGDRECY